METYYLSLDVDKADVVQFVRVSSDDGPSGVNLAETQHVYESYLGLAAEVCMLERVAAEWCNCMGNRIRGVLPRRADAS